MLRLGYIIRDHGVSCHCYADDTHLYISLRPDETYQFEKLTECIVDIKNWMTSNFLLLNSEKTEVLIIRPKTSICNNLEHRLKLDGCYVNSLSSVRNLVSRFMGSRSHPRSVMCVCVQVSVCGCVWLRLIRSSWGSFTGAILDPVMLSCVVRSSDCLPCHGLWFPSVPASWFRDSWSLPFPGLYNRTLGCPLFPCATCPYLRRAQPCFLSFTCLRVC